MTRVTGARSARCGSTAFPICTVRARPAVATGEAVSRRHALRRALAVVTSLGALAAALPAAASAESFVTLPGYDAPGPARYDKVGVLKQGPARAKNVLVLEPGTSASAAYFRLVGADLVRRLPGWQVWSVERRENLFEDHSVADRYKRGQISGQAFFDYYLGWIGNDSVSPRFRPRTAAEVGFAREWGLSVAMEDLRRVIGSARRGGRRVVLGGHSLGGNMTAAYATWDFSGRAGGEDLDGLVLIDGGSGTGTPERPTPTPEKARADLAALAGGDPFLDLAGNGLSWTAGVFNLLGSTLAVREPAAPAVLGTFALLPPALKPPVPATNRGGYGYALDTETGPANLRLVQQHLGSLATSGELRDWINGELGSVDRAARAFSGPLGRDGTAWYHPRRLSLDAGVTNGGVPTPAQRVLGVRTTHGRDLDLAIYAFETSLGKGRVLRGARALARRSGIAERRVTLVDRSATYAHVDPLTASPDRNAFVRTVVPFLRRLR